MATKTQDVQAVGAEAVRRGAGRPANTGVIAPGAGSIRSERTGWAEWLKAKTFQRALFAAGDAFALVISHVAAKTAATRLLHITSDPNPRGYWLFYLPLLMAVLYLLEGNHNPDVRRPEKELELAVKGISFAFLLLVCANFVVFKAAVFSRYVFLAWYFVALPLVLMSRFGLRRFFTGLWRRGVAKRRTICVGSPERLAELHSLLAIQRYEGYEFVRTGDGVEGPERRERGEVAGSAGWRELVQDGSIEQVVLCAPGHLGNSNQLAFEMLEMCLPRGIDVQVYSDVFASRKFNYELDEFSGFFRFYSAARWAEQAQRVAKRVLDLAAGVAGSVITLLVLPFIALMIQIDDPGPIFFSREFVDRDGTIRYYRKFRTMFIDAQETLERDPVLKANFEHQHKLVHDPRVTRVGRLLRKYSIDELPQFFSLFEGRLSLVGPRVISRQEGERYGKELPRLLSVRPGLTGFWQVMGRQLTSYEERIRMDMFYIDHWSIWLDLWIVAKTFVQVARAEGAY